MATKVADKKKDNKKAKSYPPGANGAFLDVAEKLGRAKWIAAGVLVLTLLFSFIFGGGDMSVYNLQYLMKHFDVNSEGNAGNFATLKYESDASYAFGYYKDDFVLVNSTDIDYYDMKGNSVLSESLFMNDPQVLTTDKYMFIYDQGNVSYSIYDAFFNVKSGVTEYPIWDMASCDEGSYAFVTRDLEYRGAVYVYDRNFKLKNEILKDKLVFDVCFSSDGSHFAVISVETTDEGDYYAEVQSLKPGSAEAEFTVTLSDRFPVSIGYFGDGSLGVLFEDRFIVLDPEGNTAGEYLFYDKTPTAFSYNGNLAAVSFNNNIIGADSTLRFFDSKGAVTAETVIDGQVKRILMDDAYAYTMLTDAVARVSLSDGTSRYESTESNPLDFLVRDEHSLLLCYDNRVESKQYAFEQGKE